MTVHQPKALTSRKTDRLHGRVTVPGDKSISHRAVMLGALAIGETTVSGLLEGEDVMATAAAMRAYGAHIIKDSMGLWHIHGVGVGGLLEPENVIDMGNSGTSTRLLMGLAASCPIVSIFTGDASLRRRPMGRVTEPLTHMGAEFSGRDGGLLPMTIQGRAPLVPITYRLPVASAQVKSAILLAGLNTPGKTTIIEPEATRDHSERMLRGFGATIDVEVNGHERIITITGESELKPQAIVVPGDPSSAAFPLVAAVLVAGSDVVIENVGVNPTRAGLIKVLQDMGAHISLTNHREVGGEPVADVLVKGGALNATETMPDIVPTMVDEFPVLFVTAALADGVSRFNGLAELRVKESDRITVMAEGLKACGVPVLEGPDWIEITGSGGAPVYGGATIASHLDHRIAMSFAVLGLVAKHPITIDDASPIATSFPSFVALMQGLGAEFTIAAR